MHRLQRYGCCFCFGGYSCCSHFCGYYCFCCQCCCSVPRGCLFIDTLRSLSSIPGRLQLVHRKNRKMGTIVNKKTTTTTTRTEESEKIQQHIRTHIILPVSWYIRPTRRHLFAARKPRPWRELALAPPANVHPITTPAPAYSQATINSACLSYPVYLQA